MGEEIGPTEGGKWGIEGLEEIIVEGVDIASQGEGLSDAGVPGQEQDAASLFDIVEPGRALFQGFGIEDILGFDVFVKGEVLEAEPSKRSFIPGPPLCGRRDSWGRSGAGRCGRFPFCPPA